MKNWMRTFRPSTKSSNWLKLLKWIFSSHTRMSWDFFMLQNAQHTQKFQPTIHHTKLNIPTLISFFAIFSVSHALSCLCLQLRFEFDFLKKMWKWDANHFKHSSWLLSCVEFKTSRVQRKSSCCFWCLNEHIITWRRAHHEKMRLMFCERFEKSPKNFCFTFVSSTLPWKLKIKQSFYCDWTFINIWLPKGIFTFSAISAVIGFFNPQVPQETYAMDDEICKCL